MRPVIRMHACDYNHSAAQGAQWQELELIFSQLLQHGNMRERRERVVYALLIPTETFMHAYLGPWKLHVSMNKNVQTIIR